MRWEGGRQSENIEDRRNMKPAVMAAGGLGVMIVMVIAALLGLDPRKVAVERNLEIVPRSLHATTSLMDGDRLEIVQFVGGG